MPASYNNKPRSYSIVFASLKCHKSFRLFLAHPFMIYALSAPLTSCLKDRIAYSCMQHIMKWLLMKGLTNSKLCNELELNWNKFLAYIRTSKTIWLYIKIPAMFKIEYKLKLQSSLYRFLSRLEDDINEATTDVVSEAHRNAWMDWK